MAIALRTKFQRAQAVCDLMRDLNLRASNPVIKEYTQLAVVLLAAPPETRAAYEPRALELLAAAEERRERLQKQARK